MAPQLGREVAVTADQFDSADAARGERPRQEARPEPVGELVGRRVGVGDDEADRVEQLAGRQVAVGARLHAIDGGRWGDSAGRCEIGRAEYTGCVRIGVGDPPPPSAVGQPDDRHLGVGDMVGDERRSQRARIGLGRGAWSMSHRSAYGLRSAAPVPCSA